MIYSLYQFFSSKEMRTFLITALFHVSLYFTPSNKVTFALSILLLIVLYQHLKKIPLTLFYVFLLLLPFAKGKGLDIILLEKQYAANALFDLDYLFPFYFSTVYLGLFYIYYIRQKIFFNLGPISLSQNTKYAILFFFLFIVTSAVNGLNNVFQIPILLSSVQLVMLLCIFFVPLILNKMKNKLFDIYMVIASSTIFQSVWIILQTLNDGHLYKDIEVFLDNSRLTSLSTENSDLIRAPGTFFESSILGTFLLTNLSILALALLNKKIKRKKQRQLVIFTLALGTVSIILTGSRAIYLLLLILILFLGYTKKLLNKRLIFKVIGQFKKRQIIVPMLILSIFFVSPYLINRLSSIQEVFSKEGSGTYRIQLAEYAFRLTAKRPLLGVGNNLSAYYKGTQFPQEDYFIDPARAHNVFIQVLAETGIIGLTFFTLFIYTLFRPLIKNKYKNFNEFHLGAIAFLLCAQIYPIFINHMEIISYLFLYLGIATNKYDAEQ